MRAIAMGVGFALIWASAFSATRVVVAAFPPLTGLVVRLLLSGVIGIAIARAMGQSWRLTRQEWRVIAIFGISQNTLYLGLSWTAMQWVEASVGAITASAMPLLVAAIGWMVFGDRLKPMAVAGLVTGFAGVALIMGLRVEAGLDLFGLLLCALAAISLAFATLSVRGPQSGKNLFMMVALQMLVGGVVLVLPALIIEWGRPIVITPVVFWGVAYSIFIPGLLGMWLWLALVQKVGAVRAAVFHFLSPLFGVAIAAAWLGEPFGWGDILGAAIIAAGILMVQRSRAQQLREGLQTEKAA